MHIQFYFRYVRTVLVIALVSISIGLFVQAQVSADTTIGAAQAPTGYNLVWGDDFNDSTLDASKWNTIDGYSQNANASEDSCYFAANTAEANGSLTLSARKETKTCGTTNPDSGKKTYYISSGMVTTRQQTGTPPQKYAFTKGYIEASIKLPLGNPYWGAFWLVGANGVPKWPSYGEFDIMEQLGGYPDAAAQNFIYGCTTNASCNLNGANNINTTTLDTTADNTTARGTALTTDNLSNAWGTTSRFVRYGVLWEDNKITYFIDGRPVRSFDGSQVTTYTTSPDGTILSSQLQPKVYSPVSPSFSTVLSYPHTLIFNLAYGGTYPAQYGYTGKGTSTGYNDGNLISSGAGDMQIDYVHVYQTPEQQLADDTASPTVAIASPNDGTSIDTPTTVSVNASDDRTVAKVELYAGNTLVDTAATTAPYNFTLDPANLSRGTTSLTAVAYDAVGKQTTSSPVSVTIVKPDTSRPTAPANLSASAGYDRVTLSWSAATDDVGVTQYAIMRDGDTIGTVGGDQTSYTDSTAQPLSSYSYAVVASDAAGNSSGSDPLLLSTSDVPDTEAPSQPSNLQVINLAYDSVSLSWNAATDNKAIAGYEVYRNDSLIGTQQTGLSFTDTPVDQLTSYSYVVRAIDTSGNATDSQPFVVSTPEAPDTEAPSQPTNLSVTDLQYSSVTFTWAASTDNKAVAGYTVYRNGTQIGSQQTATSFTDATASELASYSYVVRAIDTSGNTADSSALVVTTPQSPDTQSPTAPSNLGTSSLAYNRLVLTWTASTDNRGVTGYTVYRNGAQLGSAGTTTSYTDATVAANTSYQYTVQAVDAAGNSITSSAFTVKTPPVPDTTVPGRATNLKATAATWSQINLTWTAATDNVGVTGYKIYRKTTGSYTQVGTTTSTSYSNTGLTASTSYTYYVVAYDAAGNVGASSTTATAKTPVVVTTGTITGTVKNTSNRALSGVTVTLTVGSTTKTTKTSSTGTYSFTGVTAGTYTIKFTLSGYKTVTTTVTVTAGQTTTLSPTLSR